MIVLGQGIMSIKKASLLTFVLFVLVGVWPTLASAKQEFIIASRQETLVNRFGESVLKELYGRLNIKVQFVYLPGAQSIVEANAGLVDGEVSRLETVLASYPNLRLVPVPMFMSDLSAFIHKDSTIQIDSWQSLAGHKTTTIDGFKFVKSKLAAYDPVIVDTSKQAVTLVETQDRDVAVLNRLLGVLAMAEARTKNVKVVNPPLDSKPAYHLVHKKHEALIPDLTTAMQAMKDEGTLDAMWEDFVNQEVRKAYSLGKE